MRQRRIKNLETKYDEYADIIIYEPSEMRGHWDGPAAGRPLYIEIGCGKGKFISEIAEREPEHFFVAVEGNRSVMLRALEKIRSKGLDNVIFAPEFADDLTEWFAEGEVTGIYLNFSDPLPKNYWYRRRLTYRDRLKSYFSVLKEDGTVTFKTDNTGLFDWTIQEIMAADLKILEITRDLHAELESISDPAERAAFNIETEYEAKFSGLGEKIKRVVIGRIRRSPAAAAANHAGSELENACPDTVKNAADGNTDNGNTDNCNEKRREETKAMGITSLATYNGREVPEYDRNFAATGRANAAIAAKGKDAVINGTVGALYDDDGELVVLEAVRKAIESLTARDYAEYAPIAGTPGFISAVKTAAFGRFEPKSYIRVVATPGGTGAVRTAVANYSCPGDRILIHNWYWGPYKTIAIEQGKSAETFEMFDDAGRFNLADFEYKVSKLLRNQEHLAIILNTPAGNPTGYSLTMDDWYGIRKVLDGISLDKKVALILDTAYIDYAGEEEETREFLQVVDNLRANILPIIAYSASKTFTMYGQRCGAMICLAHNPELADEFEKLCKFSARNTWSNCPRAPQVIIDNIFKDAELLRQAEEERRYWRNMLAARAQSFAKAAADAGLVTLPFGTGFFVTIPCADPDMICDALAAKDVFLIPVDGGVRVSIAAVPESACEKLPAIIKQTLAECGNN